VKRVSELRDLSDDHHTGLALAKRCRQVDRATSDSTFRQLCEQICAAFSGHLQPHFQIEEQHLLPALEAIGEPALARRIREDHADLRALLASDTLDRERVQRFGQLLEAHIRYEEREVFEPTQHRLPARSLRAIAAACQALPRSCAVSLGS
jgi:hemerythrin-like domain-containing protein